MTDLRKAAEMALEALETLWDILDDIDTASDMAKENDAWYRKRVEALQKKRWDTMITTDGYKLKGGPVEALRQALAQPEQEYVIDCPRCGHCCPNVDAVNISQERVDETSKCEHEPVAWFVQYEYRHEFLWRKPNELEQKTALEIKPLYTAPPISDYHEGLEEGFKAATREQEPFIYVREDNEKPFGGYEHCSEADVGAFPVYTAPMLYTPMPKREWVGLTDEEIYDYADKFLYQHGSNYGIRSFGKAVEAKLKEKNCG